MEPSIADALKDVCNLVRDLPHVVVQVHSSAGDGAPGELKSFMVSTAPIEKARKLRTRMTIVAA